MNWRSRRAISPIAAFLVFVISIQSIWTQRPSENLALRWTLILVVLAVTVKALLSAWMWWRMRR